MLHGQDNKNKMKREKQVPKNKTPCGYFSTD
jgi:hypothetical protein